MIFISPRHPTITVCLSIIYDESDFLEVEGNVEFAVKESLENCCILDLGILGFLSCQRLDSGCGMFGTALSASFGIGNSGGRP